MTDDKMTMNDEVLEDVTGGRVTGTNPPTHSNFCPRCRSPKHHTIRMEDMMEVRVCDVCHFEYFYRVR